MNQISWEGIFIEQDLFQKQVDMVRKKGFTGYCRVPLFPHVTSEYAPAHPHEQWYGTEVTIWIWSYIRDEQIRPENNADSAYTKAEGFLVKKLESDNEALNQYLEKQDRLFHVTISFSNEAVDTNYVDCKKEVPYQLCLKGTFGGYDKEKESPVFS